MTKKNQFIQEQESRGVYDPSRWQEMKNSYTDLINARLTGNYNVKNHKLAIAGGLQAGLFGTLGGLFLETLAIGAVSTGPYQSYSTPDPNFNLEFLLGGLGIGAICSIFGVLEGRKADKNAAIKQNKSQTDYFEQYAQEFDQVNGLSESEGLVALFKQIGINEKARFEEQRERMELEANLR
ncbi:MAG: hypothetical protein NTX24_04800 [Candidatus Pacearchaeota archaeon]|nr:hypothetical protein [Candidatus Pacearchaeota archaeon]